MDININMNENDALDISSLLLSSFGSHAMDSNGDSEDSSIGASNHRQNTEAPPPPRQKINARERYRTFNVNAAYEALRGLIPTEPVNRKLSKIEIIRLASSYITHLRSTLHAGSDRQPCLLRKCEHNKYANDGSGAADRVNICTFCMKPRMSQVTESR
ncbi:transcription factor 15 [Drosophila grimshawi]|uniref:GH11812 n=1 Tax=Drosophila grimshawi TaxID=7222 RepID=B4JIS2_DROGR|nr:transcription factor 15 [Drosophila grimshawi]EDW00519.1 GH11812 [Drosophila grimshawi]